MLGGARFAEWRSVLSVNSRRRRVYCVKQLDIVVVSGEWGGWKPRRV